MLRRSSSPRDAGRWRIWLVMALLAAGLVAASEVVADPQPLRLIWSDSFANGRLNGWTCSTFRSSDCLRVVPAVQKGARCEWVLQGRSLSSDGGCGYLGVSPDLEALGLDFSRPYRIRFRYQVPAVHAYWTYALSDRAVTLAVRQTDLGRNKAEFGWLSRAQDHFEPMAELELGRWYRIVVCVFPRPGDLADFTVHIDGVRAGGGSMLIAPDLKRVRVLDAPRQATDGNPGTDLIGGCGAGFWDDFEILGAHRGEQPPGRKPGSAKLALTVAPNPSNPATKVRFELSRPGHVTVEILAINGRTVSTLHRGPLGAGSHALSWRGRDGAGRPVSSGVYFARVITPEGAGTVRLSLVR